MPETKKEKPITFEIKEIEKNLLRVYSPHGIIDIKKPNSFAFLNEEHLQEPPKAIAAKVLKKPYVDYLINKIKVNYKKFDKLKPKQTAYVGVRVK